MDEHKCQNQSLISTISFRLQVCWYCCYGLSRGLKLGSHLSLIQWPRQEALWIHEQLPMSVHCSSIYHQSPGHFSLKNVWQVLWAPSAQLSIALHFAVWLQTFCTGSMLHSHSWEAKNITVFYGTRMFITVFKRVPLVTSPNQVNSVFVLSFWYVRSTLILSSHLFLDLPSALFPLGFPLKSWTHLILLDVFKLTVFD